MNKIKLLKKSLAIQGAITLSTLVVCAMLTFFALSFLQDTAFQLSTKKTEVSNLSNDLQIADMDFKEAKRRLDEYLDLDKSKMKLSFTDRSALEGNMTLLKEAHGLVSLKSKLKPEQESTSPEYANSSAKAVIGELEMQAVAITDEDIFNFVGEFTETIGYNYKVNLISMKREVPFSETMLQNVRSGGNPDVIKANISIMLTSVMPLEGAGGVSGNGTSASGGTPQ
jgi:hypothetical protein